MFNTNPLQRHSSNRASSQHMFPGVTRATGEPEWLYSLEFWQGSDSVLVPNYTFTTLNLNLSKKIG